MFEYKGTERFDIGSGYGKKEYDFFTVNGEEDFWALINYYGAVYKRFNYFADGYHTKENNTVLSSFVQAKMKEHNANLSLTLDKEEFIGNNTGIRVMIVNELTRDGIYNTHFFDYYYFAAQSGMDYLERGIAYAKSNLHNAAIRYFSHSIRLSPKIPFPYHYRGISFMELQNYDRAIEDFTQAINLNPMEFTPFTLRGICYREIGDIDKAKADFARALELNPTDELTNECLGKINEA